MKKRFIFCLYDYIVSDYNVSIFHLELLAFLNVDIDTNKDFWTSDLYRFCDTSLSQQRYRSNGVKTCLTTAIDILTADTKKNSESVPSGYDKITIWRAEKAGRTDECLLQWRKDVLEYYSDPTATEENEQGEQVEPTEQVEELDEYGLTHKQREILNVVIDHLPELPTSGTTEGFWIDVGNHALNCGKNPDTLKTARNRGVFFTFQYNDIIFKIGQSKYGIWAKINDNGSNRSYYKRNISGT